MKTIREGDEGRKLERIMNVLLEEKIIVIANNDTHQYINFTLNKNNAIKVYTEGLRVQVLNRRAIGCKSLNVYPIV